MKALGLSLVLGSVVALSGGCGTILGFEDPTLEAGSGGSAAGASGQSAGGGQAGDTQTTGGGNAGGAATGGAGKGGMQAGGAGEGGTQTGDAGAGDASGTGGTNGQAGGGVGGTNGQAGGGAGGSAGQTGKACGVGHLIISQVRTRGVAGASDEFVEIYNATSAPVNLDAAWSVDARSSTAGSFAVRWTGTGGMVAAYGHFLIVGSGYTQAPGADVQLSAATGLTDAGSVRLLHNNTPVDVVCFGFNASTIQALATDITYQCPGTPASNLPHNDATAGNSDVSLARKTRSGTARCLDTGDNANDFESLAPAAPLDAASAPTP